MKIALIIAAALVGLPVTALTILFAIGSLADSSGKKAPVSMPDANKPIAAPPLPDVAPDPNGLQSPDVDTRQRAASRLGETARVADYDALRAALATETNVPVRAAILTGLGKQYVQSDAVKRVGADALLSLLLPELHSTEASVRSASVRACGWSRDPRVADYLLPLLNDPDASIRQEAIASCGAAGGRRATPALLALLTSHRGDARDSFDDRWERIRAVNALGHLKDERAIRPLMDSLDAEVARPSPRDNAYLCAVIRALGEIGDVTAGPKLRAFLDDADPNVRFDTICALARLRDLASTPRLEMLARGDRGIASGQHLDVVAIRAVRFIRTGRGKVNDYE